MACFHRILMATDFSEASVSAWKKALSLAGDDAAELVVLHAYEPPNLVYTGGIAPGHYEAWDQDIRTSANEKLDRMVAEAAKQGVRARRTVQAGETEEVIVQAAEDLEADLIVMGTHGRTGLSRVFLGSVATRVIATAPCAVLTVRR